VAGTIVGSGRAVDEQGDRPAAGCVLLAGGNEHLIVKASGRLGYTAREGLPSVD